MNDIIQAMKSKILQTIKEADGGKVSLILFLVLGFLLVGVLKGMEEYRFIEWMGRHLTLVVVLIVLFFLYMTIAMFLRHRRWMRQHDIDILNADVSKLDDEAARRAEKYQGK
jgi:hypothetical protein